MLYSPEIKNIISNVRFCQDSTFVSESVDRDIRKLYAGIQVIEPDFDGDKKWLLWLKSERGDISAFGDFKEWKDNGEVDTYEDYVDLWKMYFPDEFVWHKFNLIVYKDSLYIFFDLKQVIEFNIVTGVITGMSYIDEYFEKFISWMTAEVLAETEKFLTDPIAYNKYISENLSLRMRTGKLKRKVLWDTIPDSENFSEKLGEDNVARFEYVVNNNNEDLILDTITLNDFLRFCEICYDANKYFDKANRKYTAKEKYGKFADQRDGGLMDIEPDSPVAFKEWYHNGNRMGAHPWEICSGGNSTHISLQVADETNGWRLYLAGLFRTVETIKMAIALFDNNIPFTLSKKQKLLKMAKGNDDLGVVPEGVIPAYCYSMFPPEDGIFDYINIWWDREEAKILVDHIEWYPVKEIGNPVFNGDGNEL